MAETERLWIAGHDTPVWMLEMAQEVNDMYNDLSLSWIPPEFRGPEDTRPFAIVAIDPDNNILGIVARFSELEFYPSNIVKWLYEHDTTRTDVWGNYMKELKKEERERDAMYQERNAELVDQFGYVAKSPLHTYRINGHKVGEENNYPTLGLFDASGEDQ